MIALAMPRKELGSRVEARTREIERCLAMNADWIIMMDSDQTMPEDALAMFDLIVAYGDPDEWGVHVIDAPSHNATDSNVHYHPDGILASFTISCCLIHKSVFEKLEKPWFSSEYAYIEEGKENGKIKWRIDKKFADDNEGEDIYFSRKCIEANIPIEILPLKCQHFDLGDI